MVLHIRETIASFPKGFPVGQVRAARNGKTFKEIYVAPSGMQGGVEEVLIVLQGVHQEIPEGQIASPGYKILAPPAVQQQRLGGRSRHIGRAGYRRGPPPSDLQAGRSVPKPCIWRGHAGVKAARLHENTQLARCGFGWKCKSAAPGQPGAASNSPAVPPGVAAAKPAAPAVAVPPPVALRIKALPALPQSPQTPAPGASGQVPPTIVPKPKPQPGGAIPETDASGGNLPDQATSPPAPKPYRPPNTAGPSVPINASPSAPRLQTPASQQ